MPEKSGFFDSTADDVRAYPARDFADYFAMFVTNGVFNGGTNLEVNAVGNDANVRLNVGYAWINGYVYSVYDNPIVLGIEPATTQDRIDRIILRLDTSTPVRLIKAIVVQGNPGVTPTPPALVRSGNIYDLSLAQIRVKANSTVIQQANITDERLNGAVCGLVNSLIRVDTATFQKQWDDFMKSLENQGYATNAYVNSKFDAIAQNYVRYPAYAETTSASTSSAYVVNLNPAPSSLPDGFGITIVPNLDSTGSPTLKINVLAAVPLKNKNGTPIQMISGKPYTFRKKGTDFLADSSGGGVKRVQRGRSVISAGEQSVMPTINEVDLNKALLKFEYGSGGTDGLANESFIYGQLNSNNSIIFSRYVRPSSSVIVDITWEVVEFENVRSLYRGYVNVTGSNGVVLLPREINVQKSFFLVSFNSIASAPINTFMNVRGTLSGDRLSLYNTDLNRHVTVAYQVIEFE
ncbi:hypothetical protein GTY77_02080 [Streptomyces sp. SID8380]|nr:hypothetical protein [Streptomyces sp. SID8380]